MIMRSIFTFLLGLFLSFSQAQSQNNPTAQPEAKAAITQSEKEAGTPIVMARSMYQNSASEHPQLPAESSSSRNIEPSGENLEVKKEDVRKEEELEPPE